MAQIGWAKTSFGGYLANFSKNYGYDTSRKALQDLGDKMIQADPKGFLIEVIKFSGGDNSNLIFEGVRHKIVLEHIKNLSRQTYVLFLDTPEPVRLVRFNWREKSNVSLEAFRESCNHIVESEIQSIKGEADMVVDGTMTLSEMVSRISLLAFFHRS